MSPRARTWIPIAVLALAGVGGLVATALRTPERPVVVVPEGTPPAWKGEGLERTGARVLALEHLPATWALPEGADAPSPTSSWVVTDLAPRKGDVWRGPLPFDLPKGQGRFAPEGMTVLVDGVEAVFQTREDVGRRRGKVWWQLGGGELEIGGVDGEPKEVRIDYPGLPAQLGRLSWAASKAAGLTPDEFVHHHASLGDDARAGLLLPAPTTASWEGVTVPAGAHFEAHVTLAPVPLARRSDGAEVVLAFRGEDGAETELGRTSIAGDTAAFTPWKVDLAAVGGKQGALVLRTLPGAAGDAQDDAVFVGAPMVVGKPDGDVRRIVVIGIDTLRPDHLSMNGYPRATSPELDAWAQDAVIFDRAWTSAPRTRPSFRAATTGRNPLEAICAKNIGAVFDEAGFATAGIVANVHLNTRFDFHKGFDLWHLDSGAKVDQQVDDAIAWLDEHQDRDSYLFLHVMDPHVFYVAPEPYATKFEADLAPLSDGERLPYAKLNRQRVWSLTNKGELSDLQRQHIVARYDGEIAWTSAELGRLLAHLDTLPGRTAVVLHNDHGEEFWEHGGYEHNHTLYDDTTRGVLIIKPPGGAGGRTDVLATLPDIAPTLYELAGLEHPPETDGRSLVDALRGAQPDEERAIPIGYLQYEAERWGVVWHGHKYVLFTGTGKEELYDLAADPGEQDNLADQKDTTPWWQKLAETHKVQVGPGWRLHVEVPPGQTLVVKLPKDAIAADVLDPESVTKHPVNQEWGEVPPVLPADVGGVTLDDPRTLRFTAGQKGEGIVWVRFADATPAGGEATLGDDSATLGETKTKVGGATVSVKPGIVVLPRESEADAMRSCLAGAKGGGSAAEDDMLKQLGYKDMHVPPGD